MKHLEQRKILLILLTVLVAAFVWYYFANVYNTTGSVHGILVQRLAEDLKNCGRL